MVRRYNVTSMARIELVAPERQHYACRDCPARCCRVPWQIRFPPEVAARYVAEPWIQQRLSPAALDVLAGGVLPMREHARRLQCVFLDDDQLCALQKQFGHDYIPSSCQAFPFGFVAESDSTVLAQLSQLCPSIRDDYGDPVGPQLKAKLRQVGEPERMSTAMSTRSRVFLTRRQYLAVAAAWQTQLDEDLPPLEVLAALYDRTVAFEAALPADVERVADPVVDKALAATRPTAAPPPLAAVARPTFHARATYAYLLGNLCYPARVRQPHAVDGAPALGGLRAWRNRWAWMRQRGTVDLLFVDGPVRLAAVREVAPCLTGATGATVRRFLATVVRRRHLFGRPRYVLDVLVDLGLAAIVIARFARCRASAAGRGVVEASDVAEGISVAELVLTSHLELAEQGKTLATVRQQVMSDREAFRGLLASEL